MSEVILYIAAMLRSIRNECIFLSLTSRVLGGRCFCDMRGTPVLKTCLILNRPAFSRMLPS
jgi:hypothetical protein